MFGKRKNSFGIYYNPVSICQLPVDDLVTENEQQG